jgi:aspartyl-tRNA synthetase
MAMSQAAKTACGAARAADAGRRVELDGWVNRRRDHGGLIFADVRDHTGITQVVFDPQHACFSSAEQLRHEDVVRVCGTVAMRPAGTENPRLGTGDVEVRADDLEIVNRALVPPFAVNADEAVDENLRLQYRYLDLRRPRLQDNLRTRHRMLKAMRDFFDERGFVEIETPILIKATPEGARDYLVPSRLHPGSFYALPQSPQMLKQILMVGGIGRYMQIARCMRDEDLRADRQPEFTQLDIEMSFCTQEDVLETIESCMRRVWREALGVELPPFARMPHRDAIGNYGSDKPDLRFGLELTDVRAVFAQSAFAVFAGALSSGGAIVCARYPGGAALSRREFDGLTELVKTWGGRGVVWIALNADGVKSPAAKFLSDAEIAALRDATGAQTGDALLLFAGARDEAYALAGKMRVEIGDRCGVRDPSRFAFCWVTGFPFLEWDEETQKPAPSHHPFTAPAPGQWELIDSQPMAMRAQHYDLVLNGYELGSGSIRIHRSEQQRKVFEMLGMAPEEIEDRFGFFLRALDYGAPPHGGMALGIDRMVMLARGEDNIREVIAFPKNQVGRDLMMDAPSEVPAQSLRELHLRSTAPPP